MEEIDGDLIKLALDGATFDYVIENSGPVEELIEKCEKC